MRTSNRDGKCTTAAQILCGGAEAALADQRAVAGAGTWHGVPVYVQQPLPHGRGSEWTLRQQTMRAPRSSRSCRALDRVPVFRRER